MNKLFLIDNNGKEYFVKDPQRFFDHLINFHSRNNTGNCSVHEENGFYFTVTESVITH